MARMAVRRKELQNAESRKSNGGSGMAEWLEWRNGGMAEW